MKIVELSELLYDFYIDGFTDIDFVAYDSVNDDISFRLEFLLIGGSNGKCELSLEGDLT